MSIKNFGSNLTDDQALGIFRGDEQLQMLLVKRGRLLTMDETKETEIEVQDVLSEEIKPNSEIDAVVLFFPDLEIEPNDVISEANPVIGRDTLISGEISTEDDVDLFGVRLFSGQTLFADIDAEGIGSSLDSVLRLFDSEGNQLAVNDDSGDNRGDDDLDSSLKYTVDESGIYYVGVSSFANFDYDPINGGGDTGSSTGFYDLSLAEANFDSPFVYF